MKNIVRQAKEDDFEQIHNLLLQLHNIHVEARPDIYKDVDPIDKKIYERDLKDITKINFVAEKNNKIVGVCFAEIKKTITNDVMRDRTIINIRDLCVEVKERRKGIGKLLYDEVIKIAGRLKVDSVELMVWGFNEEAIRFYEKIGMDIKNLRFEKKIR